jgi:hypothetical protein
MTYGEIATLILRPRNYIYKLAEPKLMHISHPAGWVI